MPSTPNEAKCVDSVINLQSECFFKKVTHYVIENLVEHAIHISALHPLNFMDK